MDWIKSDFEIQGCFYKYWFNIFQKTFVKFFFCGRKKQIDFN